MSGFPLSQLIRKSVQRSNDSEFIDINAYMLALVEGKQ